MKKTLLAIALIMIIATGAIFAADPADASFEVKTVVTDYNVMQVSTTEFVGNTVDSYGGLKPVESVTIGNDGIGVETPVAAYLSVLSNRRTGFYVEMSAAPMVNDANSSAAAPIHYTVSCGGQAYDTSANSPTAVTVLTGGQISTMTGYSEQVSILVDPTSYGAAVTGSYTGEVTFTFTAN